MTDTTPDSGHDNRLCGSPTHATGNPCRRPAGWGTSHPGLGNCKLHGGSSPNGVRHAEVLAAEQQQARAADLLRAQGIEPVADPVAALRSVAGEHRVLTAAARQTMAEVAERDIGPDIDPGDVLRATAIIDALRQAFRLARTTDLDEAEILSRIVGLEESTNP